MSNLTDLQKLENFLQMNLPFAIGRMVRYYKNRTVLTDEDIINYFKADHNIRLTKMSFKMAMRVAKVKPEGWLTELDLKNKYKDLLLSEAIRLYNSGTYRKY